MTPRRDSPIRLTTDSRGRVQRRSARTGRYAKPRGWEYAEDDDGPEGPSPPEMPTPSAVDGTSSASEPTNSFRFLTDTSYGMSTATDTASSVSSSSRAPLVAVLGSNGGPVSLEPERPLRAAHGPNGGQDVQPAAMALDDERKPIGTLSHSRAAQAPGPAVTEDPPGESHGCQTVYPNPYVAERASQASQDRAAGDKAGKNHHGSGAVQNDPLEVSSESEFSFRASLGKGVNAVRKAFTKREPMSSREAEILCLREGERNAALAAASMQEIIEDSITPAAIALGSTAAIALANDHVETDSSSVSDDVDPRFFVPDNSILHEHWGSDELPDHAMACAPLG